VEIPAKITVQASATHELEPVAHAAEQVSGQTAEQTEAVQPEVAQPAPIFGEFVADLEASLGEDFLAAAPMPPESLPAPSATPVVARTVSAPPAPAISTPLAAGAAASASSTNTTPSPQNTPAPVASAAPHIPIPMPPPIAVIAPIPPLTAQATTTSIKSSPFSEETGIDLNEMFGELKQDLESGVSPSEEDPETHYNLGVAFREMGLLDEAIGELQKTCQSIDRGHAFPQTMQAYTWLAQCFLEKGVPEAAVGWYDKALRVPGIDGETRVALHYELGSAFESAGDKPAALKNFLAVYGSNIDYRDVAERIKALKS
jgi:Tetratricopeptide repeat